MVTFSRFRSFWILCIYVMRRRWCTHRVYSGCVMYEYYSSAKLSNPSSDTPYMPVYRMAVVDRFKQYQRWHKYYTCAYIYIKYIHYTHTIYDMYLLYINILLSSILRNYIVIAVSLKCLESRVWILSTFRIKYITVYWFDSRL